MPERIHFILEWARKKKLTQADICRETGADKGLVSRWFTQGIVPNTEYRQTLAQLFGTDVHGLFVHPDDYELIKLFRDKTDAQKAQAIDLLKVLFRE